MATSADSPDPSSDRAATPYHEHEERPPTPGRLSQREIADQIEALTEQEIFGVYVIQDGIFRYVNETLAETFGYDAGELVGRRGPLDLVAPEDRKKVRANIRRRLEGQVRTLRYSFRGLKKDGSRIHVEVHGERARAEGEPAVAGVLLDVTGRRELERQMIRAQKMEAVGLLASGIAHDFNNILTVVAGHADLLLDDPADPNEVRDGLREIRRAVDRAQRLTREILTFGRDVGTGKDGATDLDPAFEEIREMVSSLTGDDIEVAWCLGADEARVGLGQSRLGQVLMNLIVNARDAMPEGGRIRIRTSAVDLGEEYARRHLGLEPGGYAQLSVRDTGRGMDPEVQERIFEPFFSTKERGKGTGLGLSTVYGIVREAGGHVWVYSEPGRGTHFKIHHPLVDALSRGRPGPRGGTTRPTPARPLASTAPRPSCSWTTTPPSGRSPRRSWSGTDIRFAWPGAPRRRCASTESGATMWTSWCPTWSSPGSPVPNCTIGSGSQARPVAWSSSRATRSKTSIGRPDSMRRPHSFKSPSIPKT